MRTTRQLVRSIALLAVWLLGAFSSAVYAEAAEPPAVVETWACSYNDGKDLDDLMKARDYYVKQADKAGLSLGPAYLWSLIKGDVGFDILWLEPHASFAAFAAATDAEGASSDMEDVPARFDEVADCTPRMGMIEQVFERVEAGDGDANIISSSACSLKPGVGPAHVGDLRRHIAGVLGGLGNNTPNSVYTISPTTGGANTPELVLFTVNESLASYAAFTNTMFGSEAGQQLGRHFGLVVDCNLAMWSSQQVIAAPEG